MVERVMLIAIMATARFKVNACLSALVGTHVAVAVARRTFPVLLHGPLILCRNTRA